MKRLLICLFVISCSLLFLYSCAVNKHFAELRGAFSYDAAAQAFIKYPSEFMYEPNEFLAYYPENSRTRSLEYQILELTFQAHDAIIGEVYDYDIKIAFTVHNNRLLVANIPRYLPLFNYFRVGNSTDLLIITVSDDNAYLVNLNDGSIQRLLDDSNFGNYFNRESIKTLVFARVLSVSPDGRYILFTSNRNFMGDGMPNHSELFAYDIQTGTQTKIMEFNDNKELLTWDRYNPDSFLFREERIARDGMRYFTPIFRYSLSSGEQSVFLNIGERYRAYQMAGEEHIYVMVRTTNEETGRISASLYIANIYTHETFAVDVGAYNINIWNVRISDSGEYLAFWGSYMIPTGIVLTDVVTIHIPTNHIMPQYEQSVNQFVINSFYWAPNNILMINFIDTTAPIDGSRNRFHRITHSASGVEPNVTAVHGFVW